MKLYNGETLVYEGPVRSILTELKLKHQLVTKKGIQSTYHTEADIEFFLYGNTDALRKCYYEGSQLKLDITIEGKNFTGSAYVTQWTHEDCCPIARIHCTIDNSEITIKEPNKCLRYTHTIARF